MRELTRNNRFKKINMIMLIILIVLQPVLDTYYLYSDKVVNLIGFSPATIIRIMLVGALFLFAFFNITWEKKWIALFSYTIIVSIYFVIHNYICSNFTTSVPNNVVYSVKQELFYIVQIILPQLVIFITFFSEINDKLFEKTILILVGIIAGSIVIGDIFKISLGSYTNEVITGNMIQWLMNGFGNLSFSDFASKGFFYFANRVSVALIMLLPINFCYTLKKSSIKRSAILITHIISLIMLGTKVATLGGILVLIVMLFIYSFFSIKDRKIKLNFKYIALILFAIAIYGLIIPKSPAIYRQQIAENVQEEVKSSSESNIEAPIDKNNINSTIKDNEVKNNIKSDNVEKKEEVNNQAITSDSEKEQKIRYIEDNYKHMGINEYYIMEAYSYKEDPDFWINIFNEPAKNRLNQRFVQTKMIERVREVNNNKVDNWFGIGKTRIESIYNIEKDFVYQYFSLGTVGLCIFIMPLPVIMILCGIVCLIRYKELFNMENVSLIASIFLALVCSWYNGNSLDSLFISIIIAFIEGKLLYNVFLKGKVVRR